MNLEIKNLTFGENNYDEYDKYDEFGAFENIDTAKEKSDKNINIIDINTNTKEELFDTMSDEFNNELNENTLNISNSLNSTLELDKLTISMNTTNDKPIKKTIKKIKPNKIKRFDKPTKIKKLNPNKYNYIENYKYAA